MAEPASGDSHFTGLGWGLLLLPLLSRFSRVRLCATQGGAYTWAIYFKVHEMIPLCDHG